MDCDPTKAVVEMRVCGEAVGCHFKGYIGPPWAGATHLARILGVLFYFGFYIVSLLFLLEFFKLKKFSLNNLKICIFKLTYLNLNILKINTLK
jgi:hypothetical protein